MRLTIFLAGLLITQGVCAQQFSDKITKELTFEKKSPDNALMVANINGHIKVTGYEGDKIIVEVNRSIHAKTDARLEKGKQEIQLGVWTGQTPDPVCGRRLQLLWQKGKRQTQQQRFVPQ
jgi:hypothetical protein